MINYSCHCEGRVQQAKQQSVSYSVIARSENWIATQSKKIPSLRATSAAKWRGNRDDSQPRNDSGAITEIG